jgi:hypothetical protein
MFTKSNVEKERSENKSPKENDPSRRRFLCRLAAARGAIALSGCGLAGTERSLPITPAAPLPVPTVRADAEITPSLSNWS